MDMPPQLTSSCIYLCPDHQKYRAFASGQNSFLLFRADQSLTLGPAYDVRADGQVLEWQSRAPTGWTISDLQFIE